MTKVISMVMKKPSCCLSQWVRVERGDVTADFLALPEARKRVFLSGTIFFNHRCKSKSKILSDRTKSTLSQLRELFVSAVLVLGGLSGRPTATLGYRIRIEASRFH